MRKIFLAVGGILVFGLSNNAMAQLNNRGAIGGRFGSAQGITYRHTLNSDHAFEGIVSIQSNADFRRFRVVGLYEIYKPLVSGLNWYYGFGGSVGSYKKKDEIINGQRRSFDSNFNLSIDGIVGIEYTIPQAPFQISLDIKPYYDFLNESSIKIFDPIGFSVRYTF